MEVEMKIRNLTPHPITLANGDTSITIQPEPVPARCAQIDEVVGEVALTDSTYTDFSVPIVRSTYGEITGLPEPQEGVIYVTSLLVAQAAAAQGRRDVFAVGRPIRDAQGRIVAAGALTAVKPD